MKKKSFAYLFAFILVVALLLRLYQLDLRPMHHDEANQACKFGQLLEKGEYRYDPADHHGPTLYYFSLPLAWLSGQKVYAGLSEKTLRGVTVLFGLLLLLVLLASGKYLKTGEKSWAAVFLAVSPPLIYFSRFYIQETLFVAFGLAFVLCVWRFARKPGSGEAARLGLAAGLVYATKETSLIIFGTSLLALILNRFLSWLKGRRKRGEKDGIFNKDNLASITRAVLPLMIAILVFLAVSFIFYSSFFQHTQGLVDSFQAFSGYTQKAVEAGWHRHGFWYYFRLLFFNKNGRGAPLFSEIPFLLLALYGVIFSFFRLSRKPAENFRSYLALFAISTSLVYSAIPYKTPWNMLIFYTSFLILAGIGFYHLLGLIKIRQARVILAGVLLLWSGWQTYLNNYYFHSYPDNPYVYAQTSPDFLRLVGRVEELSQVAQNGRDMLIRVIAPAEETWPLPWYLRQYNRVGYWTASEQVEELEPAEIVIMSAGEAGKRSESELESYLTQYFSLRPDVLMILAVRQDLWENYRLRKAATLPVK